MDTWYSNQGSGSSAQHFATMQQYNKGGPGASYKSYVSLYTSHNTETEPPYSRWNPCSIASLRNLHTYLPRRMHNLFHGNLRTLHAGRLEETRKERKKEILENVK